MLSLYTFCHSSKAGPLANRTHHQGYSNPSYSVVHGRPEMLINTSVMKLFIALTLITCFSHVFSLPVSNYVPRDIGPADQLTARDDDFVVGKIGAINDWPELESRSKFSGLERMVRSVVSPLEISIKPLDLAKWIGTKSFESSKAVCIKG